MICQKCKGEGMGANYVGDTAKTPYDRGVEHLTAVEKGDTESPLTEHDEEYHGRVSVDFTMEILGNSRTSLQRQAGEYHQKDKYGEKCILLNRRGGWERAPQSSQLIMDH